MRPSFIQINDPETFGKAGGLSGLVQSASVRTLAIEGVVLYRNGTTLLASLSSGEVIQCPRDGNDELAEFLP